MSGGIPDMLLCILPQVTLLKLKRKQESTSSQTSNSCCSFDHKTEQYLSFKTNCYVCCTKMYFERKKGASICRSSEWQPSKLNFIELYSTRKLIWQSRCMGWSCSGQHELLNNKEISKTVFLRSAWSQKRKIWRPKEEDKTNAFLKVARFLRDQ